MHAVRHFSPRFSLRVAPVVALCFAMMSCESATAPDPVATGTPASLSLSQASGDPLGQLASDMATMTDWALVDFPDARGRTNVVGLLQSLKGHLAAGKIEACQEDVNTLRSFLGTLTENEQVELGGIGVTLDVVENALGKS
jgi:hypothetical protein